MADMASGQTAGMSQVVGEVFILYGNVKAIAPDGTARTLSVNTPVLAFDRIVTGDDGSVSIMLEGPPPTQLDIGRTSDVIIDEDVFGGAGAEDIAGAAAGVEEIQQVLLEGGIGLEAVEADEAADDAGVYPTAAFDETIDELFDDYKLVSDAGKAKLVLYDSDGEELRSVTFESIDYMEGDPDPIELSSLLGQPDDDDYSS